VRPRFPILRLIAGFVLTPALVGPVAGGIMASPEPQYFWFATAVATVYLALATLVLGLPTYGVLQVRRRTGWRVYVGCGTLLGSFVAVVIVLPYVIADFAITNADRYQVVYESVLFTGLLTGRFALYGGLAALVFWIIVRPDEKAPLGTDNSGSSDPRPVADRLDPLQPKPASQVHGPEGPA